MVLLEQNYRSTQTILSAANAVIAKNPDRIPKRLWSDAGDGEKIVGYVGDNEHDEAAFVAEEVDRLSDADGVTSGDVAVFYRTNAQSRSFEDVFIRVGLPYKVVGGVRFYERREVRDALAYLRVLANPADTVSLRRILNVPKRGIGDRAEAMVAAFADRERMPFAEALERAPRGSGHRDPFAQRHRGIHRDDGRGAFGGRCGRAAERAARADLRPHRLSQGAAGESGSAGAGPGREPRGAGVGRARVRGRAVDGGGTALADFLEQVSLVADTDEIPDGDERAASSR